MYSIWLTFEETLAQKLRDQISTLARQTGGPVFEPHLTVVGDLDLPRHEVLHLAKSIRLAFQHESGEFGNIGFGATYFQSVFLTIKLREALDGLRSSLLAQLDLSAEYPPHVSLAYGVDDTNMLVEHLSRIDQEFSGCVARFSDLVVMASSEDRPVDHWRSLEKFSLSAQ